MNGDIDLNGVPLSRLSNDSKNLLSSLLNTTKVLKRVCPDHISRYRDWRGLASLVNISTQMEASIKEYPDRVGKVIEIWLQNDYKATIGQLMHYLQLLDRFDVYDDLLELARNNKLLVPPPSNEVARIDPVEDDLITFQDVQHNSPQQYHAYVLFSPKDRDFVDAMLARLRDNGMKLCTEDDLLPGFATRFEPVARLIAERCSRIILVYSPDFFETSALKFLTNVAQAHGVESDLRNLVPIMYRPCELPRVLSHYHNLVYSQRGAGGDQLFWRKLVDTLHQPPRARAPRLRNGTVSSASSVVRIQEVPSIGNGYIQYNPTADTSQEQASSRFTPHKEEQRLALPEIPKAKSGSVTSLPSALRRPQDEPLPSLPSPPSEPVPSSASEPLPPYYTDASSLSDIRHDVKSKKKNKVERFLSQVRAIPSRIGKKKKSVMVEG